MSSRELRAGPLTVLFEDGGLRYVRRGSREVIRGIYAAVRDAAWDTVGPEISGLRIDARESSFELSFDARCRRGEIDFAWKGAARGTAEGTVSFRMEGEARTTFFRNRIGICVLHPVRECAGRPCTVVHSDGSVEQGAFPRSVSPHQPFLDVRRISHEVVPGLLAEVAFEGDVFEMEDQRNWIDASFKTYSTPLRLPIPAEVPAGTRIVQSVTVSLRGSAPAPPPPEEPVRFAFAERLPVPLPALGAAAGEEAPPPRVSHLRVDLRGADAPRFFRAAAQARRAGAALEVALRLEEEVELLRLPLMIAEAKVPVARVLLFPTQQDWICLARKHLPGIRLGGGSEAFLAELNRRRPPVELLDLVTFPADPQVHAADDRTLVENLEGLGYAVEAARAIAADRAVAVTPLAFRRGDPDPREDAPFGACWVAGAVKYAAEAGAAGVTFRLSGRAARSALAELAEFGGGVVLPTVSSDPLRVDGIALEKGGRTRVLVANMTPLPQRALFEGRTIDLDPHAIVRIDR